jgi:hypothetical protein
MLMTMRAYTEGCRALAIVAAAAFDAAHHDPDAESRKQNQAFYEFMVPLVKGYSTEMSIEVASLGVQVHGGMGFIEETGAAQYLRDARILTIYEGTTRSRPTTWSGARPRAMAAARQGHRRQIAATEASSGASASVAARAMLKNLKAARSPSRDVVDFVVREGKAKPECGCSPAR